MELDFLKLTKGEENLRRMEEYWESSSYEKKLFDVSKDFFERKKYAPLGNMKIFRVLSFYIKASVKMEQIRSLCSIIKEKYQIECFQISIDREDNRAYLQFVWLNRDYESVVFSSYDWKKFTVLIIRYLNLPRPSCTRQLVKYFLRDAYEYDADIFQKQLDIPFHSKIEGLNYGLIQDALTYSEYMCIGDLK